MANRGARDKPLTTKLTPPPPTKDTDMPKAKLKSKTTSNRPAQRRLRVQRVVSRNTLARDITLLQRAIFKLRKTHGTKGRVQELLDEARETLNFAKIEAQWDAANDPDQR